MLSDAVSSWCSTSLLLSGILCTYTQSRLFVLKCMNPQHVGRRHCLTAFFQLWPAVSHGLKHCVFSSSGKFSSTLSAHTWPILTLLIPAAQELAHIVNGNTCTPGERQTSLEICLPIVPAVCPQSAPSFGIHLLHLQNGSDNLCVSGWGKDSLR